MKIAFDSSTLVAACVQNHPKHAAAFGWLQKAKHQQIEGLVCAHSLLETFSVLTRAPFKPKISPTDARNLIFQNIIPFTTVIGLSPSDYPRLIEDLASKGFEGGIVYDGSLLFCAAKGGAEKIVTANSADFLRLAQAFNFEIDIVGI